MPVWVMWYWMAYYRVSPWGDSWRRSGRLALVTASAMGAKLDSAFEDKFMPGGGKFRDMNQTEVEMLEELRKIEVFRDQIDKRR